MAAAIAMVRKQKLSAREKDSKKEKRDDQKKLNDSIEVCIKVNQMTPRPLYPEVQVPLKSIRRPKPKIKGGQSID